MFFISFIGLVRVNLSRRSSLEDKGCNWRVAGPRDKTTQIIQTLLSSPWTVSYRPLTQDSSLTPCALQLIRPRATCDRILPGEFEMENPTDILQKSFHSDPEPSPRQFYLFFFPPSCAYMGMQLKNSSGILDALKSRNKTSKRTGICRTPIGGITKSSIC